MVSDILLILLSIHAIYTELHYLKLRNDGELLESLIAQDMTNHLEFLKLADEVKALIETEKTKRG